MPNPFLITRNSCDRPLTSTDIENNDFCHPIRKCICHETWFYPVLICGIIVTLLTTCCCVKVLRPKPWKEGYFANGVFKKGEGWNGKPSRIDRDVRGDGGGEARMWPGMEMGGMGQVGRGEGRFGDGRSSMRNEREVSGSGRPYGSGSDDGRDPYRS
ncbi:MAG: hypothetical protein Q9166_001752 [cf. Caloplaca sp. 2 TL-2023]